MNNKLVRLEVYNPTGAVETTLLHAPRLDTLAGKTICELSNGGWEATRIFPAIREALQKQYPSAKILPYEEAIGTREECENIEHVSKIVKEKGCQAVITGMAA